MTQLPSRTFSRGRRMTALGFTLIEVMISVAIVLALIVGVNQVFKVTADTVGTGTALSAKIRDARAVQSVFQNETLHIPPNSGTSPAPFLYIDSRTQVAFRSARDREDDRDANPLTIDFDGDNQEGTGAGEQIDLARMSDRVHRVDTFSFFARDLYKRQTGNIQGPSTVYLSDMSTGEAWVTYQHLRVFNGATTPNPNAALDIDNNYVGPGLGTAATNSRNYYANNWVLGRVAMLLATPIDINSPKDGFGDEIYDKPYGTSTKQRFWMRKPTDNLNQLTPIGKATTIDAPPALTISDLRYDLIGTDMQELSGLITDYIEHTRYHLGAAQLGPNYPVDDWWKHLPIDPTTPTPAGVAAGPGRWRANPYPTRPLDVRKLAQTAPGMLDNCTQFAVEFAGDYLTQAPPGSAAYGDITAVGPDGVVDFYLEDMDPSSTADKPVQRIRWYGFPRDVNFDGRIEGFHPAVTAGPARHNEFVDVVPLRDIILTFDKNYYDNISSNKAKWDTVRFERAVYKTDPILDDEIPYKQDYASPTAGLVAGNHYTCVWGPDEINRPKLIRLAFAIDDPNGRLSAGQRYEYVFNMP